MNIKDAVEGRVLFTENEKKVFDTLDAEVKAFEEKTEVKEYFDKKRLCQAAREELSKRHDEYTKVLQEKCDHPLFNLVYGEDFRGYTDLNITEVECVLCGKVMDIGRSSFDKLYDSKRLIAKRNYEYDGWEGRGWHEYHPTLYTSCGIRSYYYELYLKVEEMMKLGYTDLFSLEFNIEDMVWDYYCSSSAKEKGFQKTAVKRK